VKISVIVPCYNEERTIAHLLEALCQQTVGTDAFEVVIADGMSTDATRQVIHDYLQKHPELSVQVVDNPRRHIPAGLNHALEVSSGDIVIRLDAHCIPAPDYIERCVDALEAGKGDNVGGVWQIQPGGEGWIARSIAAAAGHPLGVGDALYRFTRQPAVVDTVPFGAFRRETLQRVGGYDESLLTNEDYELNTRIRSKGGIVYLDPAIRSIYFARSTLSALAKQYFRYGYWKWRMLRRYPGTLRWRQALPPLFVLSLALLLLAGVFFPPLWLLLAIEIGVYLLALWLGALPVAWRRRDPSLWLGIPLAIMTMHLSWGSGFLWSMMRK